MKKPSQKTYVPRHLVKFVVPGVVTLAALAILVWPQIQARQHKQPAAQVATAPKTTVQTKPTPVPVAQPPATTPKPSAPAPSAKPVPKKTVAPKPAPVVVPSPVSSVDSLKPTTPAPATPTTGGDNNNAQPTSAVSYTSTNWAGYFAANASFTGVSGSWTVPNAIGNGTSTSADAAWVGIGGVTKGDLIQVGAANIVLASGQLITSAFYEMLPAASIDIPSIVVSPGDSISASVTETSANHWTIRITDNTKGQTFTKSVVYASSHSSAEWIEEVPSTSGGALMALSLFDVARFTNASATTAGNVLNLTALGAQKISLVNGAGQPLATTSAIGGDGASFSVTHN